MANEPIGLRWQPGNSINVDRTSQPPSNVAGGPTATKVLSLNLPNRPAPNAPVPLDLLRGGGSGAVSGAPGGFASFLTMLQQALSGQASGGGMSGSGGMTPNSAQAGGSAASNAFLPKTPAPRITLSDAVDGNPPTTGGGEMPPSTSWLSGVGRDETGPSPGRMLLDDPQPLNLAQSTPPTSAPEWFRNKYADQQNVSPLF